MTDQTEEMLPDLTGDWDAAHRALIYAHRAAVEDIERMDTMAAESRGRAEQAEKRAERRRRELEEINIAIDRSGWVPPKGFTKWGNPS